MMKQLQQPFQGNHPIETALRELIWELRNLLSQVGNLYDPIVQQLRTAQDQQVKAQLTKFLRLLQQHLSGVTIKSLYDTATIILWNRWRNLLNGVAEYKKLIGNQGKEDIKEKAEAAKENIKNMATAFRDDISRLEGIVVKLQQGANTLKQELQRLQSSAQQQEIASVIQQTIGAIDNMSNNTIKSIEQKLRNLENILEQIQQEVNQLGGQEKQQTAGTEAPSKEGSADGTTSTPSEQDLPTQLDELEKRIVDLYQAVVALETVVNIATSVASIVPQTIVGMNTASLAQKLVKISPKNLFANIGDIKRYTGLDLPDPLDKLASTKQQEQGNVTQLHFLKQQEVSSADIQGSIKSYIEEVKKFLLGARNYMEVNLKTILEELSKLENNIGQISDIKIRKKAQRICSTSAFVILDECKSKLTENMPPSLIETIAPIVGATLIAVKFWDSLLDWQIVGTAMTSLKNLAEKSQDPVIKTALSNMLVTASNELAQSNPKHNQPPVSHATSEEIGATVLAALTSGYVHSPEVRNTLKTQGWSQQRDETQRLRVITDTSITTKIINVVATKGVIPSFEKIQDQRRGGVVRSIKTMINAFAEYMAGSWEEIEKQINEDIREGRLSDPQKKIRIALNKINDAWKTLLGAMKEANWREFSMDIGIEKTKIEGIRRELEQLMDACSELLEAWKAAKKPKEGALDIEALLFHPLGLPALKAALRTLPPSIPGGAISRRVTQPGGGAKTGERAKTRGVTQTEGGAKTGERTTQEKGETRKRLRYRGLGRQGRIVGPRSGPISSPPPGGKETTEETPQGEIGRAINFIGAGQVDDAIKAVANAITILRDIGKQKPQPQGALPTHLREAAGYLGVALQRLRNASQLDPDSDGFNANLRQANSLLQEALKVLSNPTAGSTPYLGRNLLLLMKTLRSTPITTQSHRQRAKNEDILEKETI